MSSSHQGSIDPSARILSFEDARHLVEQHAAGVHPEEARPKEVETVDLLSSLGRVLAEQISADRDLPPFARSTRDGYAVHAADLIELPATLDIIGVLKAGDSPDRPVAPKQAIEIMTGASLPPGADAVVMVEHTKLLAANKVEIYRRASPGDNFVPRGAEAHAGQLLLDRGRRLDSAAIAIAASVGQHQIRVFRKPRIAVLATGDELVEIDRTPGPAQIRNSNSYSLAAQVQNAGAEPVRLPIAPDDRARLRVLIEEGLQSDLLLLTGGVSMGKYDLVEQVLAELNAEFYFTGAEIQPGRPVVFGSCSSSPRAAGAPPRVPAANSPSALTSSHAPSPTPRKYFFGLPGNPVSTMVTFELFVKPMIEALSGAIPQPLIFQRARLKSEIRTKTGLKRFLPASLTGKFENADVELARWQGSGDIAALTRSNCYVVVPADRERIEAGEWVSFLMR